MGGSTNHLLICNAGIRIYSPIAVSTCSSALGTAEEAEHESVTFATRTNARMLSGRRPFSLDKISLIEK